MRIVLNELMFRDIEQSYDTALRAAHWADVVVSYYGQVIGAMVAEASGKPFITAMLDPMSVPSRHRPPPGITSRRIVRAILGPWVNSRHWRRRNAEADEFLGASVNWARERVGLPPLDQPGSEGLLSRHLNLIAVSPSVIPPAPDWAPRHRLTGYWFLDDEDWPPSPELLNFISDRPKPIVVTLGGIPESVPEGEAQEVGEAVVLACHLAGVRAIVQPGALNLGSSDLPPSLLRCSDADYRWLFQRVLAAVHHCGAGTTASTLRAGIPSVAVPHSWDQPFWAGVLFDRGVTPQPIARRDITADALATRIRSVIEESHFRANAAAISQEMSNEDGLATATALIEQSVEQRTSNPDP